MWGTVASGLLSFLAFAVTLAAILLHHSGHLRWAHGAWAFLFLLVPVVFLLQLLGDRRRARLKEKLGRDDVVAGLLPAEDPGRWRLSRTSRITAVLLAVFAFLGPRMGTKLETVHRKGVDIFLAVDTSRSMDADDIKPSRMERAKMQIEDFLGTLEGDRVGLVAFAGTAFVQCPLTLDYGAVRIFLDILDTSLIPVQGTNIGAALGEALTSFGSRERKYKVIILFTDGEDHGGEALDMAKKAAEEGVVIYTIGIGSPEGSVIPLKEGGGPAGFKKDQEGKVVTSRLDETTLQKIALETGGKYYRSTTGEMELSRILGEIQKMEKRDLGSAEVTRFEDRYQAVLLPAFLLFFLAAALGLPRKEEIQ